MASFKDLFSSAWRYFVTDGVPASGPWKPSKSEIAAIGAALDTALSGAISGATPYATASALPASTNSGKIYLVTSDPTTANNGYWQDQVGGNVILTALNAALKGQPGTLAAATNTDLDAGTDNTKSVTPASLTYLGLSGQGAPNIWPDPFMEGLVSRPMGDRRTTQTYAGTLTIADPDSPFGKNTLLGAGSNPAQYYRTLRELNLRVGDIVTPRILAKFTGANGSPQMFFRDSSGNTIGSGVAFTIIGGGSIGIGTYDMAAVPTAVPANTSYIEIRVAGGTADKKLLVATMANGRQRPGYLSATLSAAHRNNVITQKNLWPDPFFRQYAAGLLYQDGYGVMQTAGQSFPASVVTSSASIYPLGKGARLPAGFISGDMCIDPRRLGMRAGDSLTFALHVNSGESLKLTCFPRDASGAVIGSVVATTYSFVSPLLPLYYTVQVTQAMLAAAIWVVRISTGSGSGLAAPVDLIARGVFVNDTQPLFYDDCFAEDMAAIERHRKSSFGLDRLREAHNRLFRIKMGATTGALNSNALSIALMSDSYGDNVNRISGPLLSYLATKANNGAGYGQAGIGFVGMAIDASGNPNGNGWQGLALSKTGTWTTSYYTGYGPDIGSITSSDTSGAAVYKLNGFPAGTGQIHVLCQPIAGTKYDYSTDSGTTWTTVDSSTGTNINDVAITTPVGAFNLWLRPNTGSPVFYGVRDTPGASGIVVHKLGATGSATSHWAPIVADPKWQASLAALNPNLVIIQLGKNDQTGGSSPIAIPTFQTNKAAIIAAVQAAVPLADILVLSQPEDQRTGPTLTPAAALASVDRNVCLMVGVAWHDLQQDYGLKPLDYADTADSAVTRNLFTTIASDGGVHPDPASPKFGGYPTVAALGRMLEFAV